MDEREVLILTRVKGDPNKFANKTRNVTHIEDKGTQYEITFANGTPYTYNKNNVQYFNQPEPISIEQSIIHIKGELHQKWDFAVIFRPYICLFRGKKSRHERLENVKIVHDMAKHGSTQHLINYYEYIASLLKHSSKHLDYYYSEKLDAIREDSVLKNFVDQIAPNKQKLDTHPIFPFGVNPSQRQAVINALKSQISLIQGPPGTGKTQTILNIIANLLVRGKTVAIVAGNNSATANVYEKLEKENIHFIAAKLGRKELQNQFFESEHSVPNTAHWTLTFEKQQYLNNTLSKISDQITQLLDSKNQHAIIKEQLNRLTLEKKVFERHFPSERITPYKWSFANQWSAPNLLKFLAEVEYYSKNKKLTWPIKLRWLYKYKIYRFKDLKNISDSTIKGIIREYYNKKSGELKNELISIESKLNTYNFQSILDQYTQISLRLFKHHIAIHIQNIKPIKFKENTYKNDFSHFLNRFPIVLSTTDSIINNKSPLELFDYLIVDEASQVDLLTGFLAMSCAKNIVAVGDLKQLPHIPSKSITNINPPIDEAFDIQPGYSYLHESLLSSLNTLFLDSAPITLLKEHYRCHPRIIDFCNQKFYNGQLVIMTESDNTPFKILKTVSGFHQRRPSSGKSLFNERELDVIINEVLNDELKHSSLDKVGITTPYRAQAERAQKHITAEGLQIDTVYKYQGREKDVIIFSTTSNYLNKFVDDPYLLNVAVSRAKDRFIMNTSDQLFKRQGSNISDLIRHIEYQSLSESIFESSTVSIFDCLYSEYADVLKAFLAKAKVKNTSKFLSENLMATLLDEVLKNERYNSFEYRSNYALNLLIKNDNLLTRREQQYGHHPNTHVDFLLYNKLDKLPVLAIEVDGYRFHELNEKQKERDVLKNSILKKIELPLIRFSTVSSGEREKLEKALEALLVDVEDSTEEQLESAQQPFQ